MMAQGGSDSKDKSQSISAQHNPKLTEAQNSVHESHVDPNSRTQFNRSNSLGANTKGI